MVKKKRCNKKLTRKELLEEFKKTPMNIEAMMINQELFTKKRVYKKEAEFIAH